MLQRHLHESLTALHAVIEAQPRCAALLASKPALGPLLQCILPFCRCAISALWRRFGWSCGCSPCRLCPQPCLVQRGMMCCGDACSNWQVCILFLWQARA